MIVRHCAGRGIIEFGGLVSRKALQEFPGDLSKEKPIIHVNEIPSRTRKLAILSEKATVRICIPGRVLGIVGDRVREII